MLTGAFTGHYHESDTLILTAAWVLNVIYCPRLQETHFVECLFCFVYLAVHVPKLESVSARFLFEIFFIYIYFFFKSGAAYLSDLLKIYTPSRQLRSSTASHMLCTLYIMSTHSHKAYSVLCSSDTLLQHCKFYSTLDLPQQAICCALYICQLIHMAYSVLCSSNTLLQHCKFYNTLPKDTCFSQSEPLPIADQHPESTRFQHQIVCVVCVCVCVWCCVCVCVCVVCCVCVCCVCVWCVCVVSVCVCVCECVCVVCVCVCV